MLPRNKADTCFESEAAFKRDKKQEDDFATCSDQPARISNRSS